jgi:hypothetical protein
VNIATACLGSKAATSPDFAGLPCRKDGAVWLQAENPAFANMVLADGQSFEVWGVITRSIRML